MILQEWYALVRQHNKLRIALNKKQAVSDKLKAEKSFRAAPHKFAANLFNKSKQSDKLTFTAETTLIGSQILLPKVVGGSKINRAGSLLAQSCKYRVLVQNTLFYLLKN